MKLEEQRRADGAESVIRVVAFTGLSGSGKTTLVEKLIPSLIARYGSVAAIKHTHHALNDALTGDTGRFRVAGAEPVILASDREAVVFTRSSTPRRIAFADPAELVALCRTDVVVIEGFKQVHAWPRVELAAERRIDPAEGLAILDRIWG